MFRRRIGIVVVEDVLRERAKKKLFSHKKFFLDHIGGGEKTICIFKRVVTQK
jgi:hypothetical protein